MSCVSVSEFVVLLLVCNAEAELRCASPRGGATDFWTGLLFSLRRILASNWFGVWYPREECLRWCCSNQSMYSKSSLMRASLAFWKQPPWSISCLRVPTEGLCPGVNAGWRGRTCSGAGRLKPRPCGRERCRMPPRSLWKMASLAERVWEGLAGAHRGRDLSADDRRDSNLYDAARTQIDDHRQVEPSRAGRDEGDITRPSAIGSRGQWLAGEKIGRRLVGSAVAGLGRKFLAGAQRALGHEAPDPGGAHVSLRSESSSPTRR